MNKELRDHTSTELVTLYNELRPSRPLRAWKGRKDELVGRVEVLQRQRAEAERDRRQHVSARQRLGMIKAIFQAPGGKGITWCRGKSVDELAAEIEEQGLTVDPAYLD